MNFSFIFRFQYRIGDHVWISHIGYSLVPTCAQS